ncbi:unnamed protein product [Peniophora sp. CBMAI 1063]|nr:unnamed protein product [Peniophora sp. CBMAI 1063]
MPGVLKTDTTTPASVDKVSKAGPSTSPTDSKPFRSGATRALFPGLSITYNDRFLHSILKPKDPSFDVHRRTVFLNLRENMLAAWHKLALEGRHASEEEEAELVKSEMQLRKMEFGYLNGSSESDRTVWSIKSNEQMWRMLTQDLTPEDLESEEKLRKSLLQHRATEARQTQALVSALHSANSMPFDRAFLATLPGPRVRLVKAEADRLREHRYVNAVPGETVDDLLQRRKLCEEWFGGVFAWPRDDGKSGFAFLDEREPSTLALDGGPLPTIKVESCVVDAMAKMTVRDDEKKT